eukprot:Gb_00464 [translate_table: standard]
MEVVVILVASVISSSLSNANPSSLELELSSSSDCAAKSSTNFVSCMSSFNAGQNELSSWRTACITCHVDSNGYATEDMLEGVSLSNASTQARNESAKDTRL